MRLVRSSAGTVEPIGSGREEEYMSESRPRHSDSERTPAGPEPIPDTRYDHATVEARWAARWVERPFTADPTSSKPPFCIVMPPPNITGVLHLGHAFDNTIIDTLIRYKRMSGYEALFQPGTDHAGISTQVQVERALEAEGTTRHAIGREAFIARAWQWRERYGGLIVRQLQRLGVSAAWDRGRFTMDEGLSNAVRLQFVNLYHQGKAYRRERIVNWDPVSRTVLSDLEVDRQDHVSELYELAYSLAGAERGGPSAINIATVRPETIFADVAIAVHPADERFKDLVGRKARIPLTDRYIEIITDEAVEIGFGTGALKITPAHDPTDYEIGERHGLVMPKVIDEDAKLFGDLVPEKFRGSDRFAARKAVVAALEESGELVSRKEHTVALGLSQRTGEPVEPLLSLQWFYDTDEAAKRALAGLDAGHTSFTPERYEKVDRDWLDNLRHWCISRQLWWGHRIPAWYDADGNVYVPTPDQPYLDPPDDPRHEGIAMTQDTDVFDTWFSSNLWPFSTLGWPDESDPYFEKFYPTSVLVTGYDILFFWVARMQLAGYELTDKAPFAKVMLHGLLLDAKGQKMSKSKGNGIDPLEVIDKYGADALRFALSRASTGSQDIRWDERQVEMGRNFATKLYNAVRFVLLQQAPRAGAGASPVPRPERLADRWILSRLQGAVAAVSAALDALDLGAANRAAYEFVWSEFCDWYLEASKGALKEGDPVTAATVRWVLADILKLLHPLMPFITTELHESLGAEGELALSGWPSSDPDLSDPQAEADFARLQAWVAAARALRAEADLPPAKVVDIEAVGDGAATLVEHALLFEGLARARLVVETAGGASGMGGRASLSAVLADVELRLPLTGQVDLAEYAGRQRSRLAKARAEVARSSGKLASEKFVASAPAVVVEEERRRLAEGNELVERIEALLGRLG